MHEHVMPTDCIPVVSEYNGILNKAIRRELEGLGKVLAKVGEGENSYVYIPSKSAGRAYHEDFKERIIIVGTKRGERPGR